MHIFFILSSWQIIRLARAGLFHPSHLAKKESCPIINITFISKVFIQPLLFFCLFSLYRRASLLPPPSRGSFPAPGPTLRLLSARTWLIGVDRGH